MKMYFRHLMNEETDSAPYGIVEEEEGNSLSVIWFKKATHHVPLVCGFCFNNNNNKKKNLGLLVKCLQNLNQINKNYHSKDDPIKFINTICYNPRRLLLFFSFKQLFSETYKTSKEGEGGNLTSYVIYGQNFWEN